ncbi:MAG: hypothetical protein ACREXP_20760 [Steroidobacteraceae bacterium]
MEFEQINDRVEGLLVELSLKGAPANPHDYKLLAGLCGLTPMQVREAVKQLFDRRRLPIPERERATA